MKQEILGYINASTHRTTMEEKSTREVASVFGLTTYAAYNILNSLFLEGLILKLDPVNSDNFTCCGWIRLND